VTSFLRDAIGHRLAVWYAGLFVGSSIFVIGLTYLLLSASLEQRDREIVLASAAKYAQEYQRGGLAAIDRAIAADRVTLDERLFVRVLGRRAEAIFFSMPADWNEFDLRQVEAPPTPGTVSWVRLRGRRSGALLDVASFRMYDGTPLQVGKSSEHRTELLARFRRVVLLALVSVVVVGVTGAALFTYASLQPIRHLIGAVKAILHTGRMSSRVPTRNTDDALDELSVLFNTMLDRIESLIAAMRGSLDNVAHDLRTPMTRLRSVAETALEGDQSREALREALSDCLEESERVVSMLETLMDISEAETGAMRLNPEPVDLAALARETAELYGDLADDKGLTVTTDIAPDCVVTADRSRLRQVMGNLVDNAVKYTPRGGRVRIEGRMTTDGVAVSVHDTGLGIPASEQPRVWDRLYRGDQSRSTRGLGLGLSLVRAIVQAHGGTVEVRSEPGAGSTFTIQLPSQPRTRQA
jgi:signal transduction histidine kinase